MCKREMHFRSTHIHTPCWCRGKQASKQNIALTLSTRNSRRLDSDHTITFELLQLMMSRLSSGEMVMVMMCSSCAHTHTRTHTNTKE